MSESDGFIAVLDEKDLQEGTKMELDVKDIPILLIKKNSEVFAVLNQCPHLGAPLAPGWDTGYMLSCKRGCAGLSFDIRTGANLDYGEDAPFKLTRFDCKVKDGKIWVKF
jgi:nitrite reductase/ring-hydroxylating ferredoxin subunit